MSEGSRVLRCKTDPTHDSFDPHHSRCGCGAPLQAACSHCGKFKSYGHVRAHESKCVVPQSSPAAKKEVVRFAYWASGWKLGDKANKKKPFSIPPRGQLWDGLPHGVPKKHGFRVHQVQDASMRGIEWMEAYDALFAHIASDSDAFKLVKVYHTWEEVVEALEDPAKALKGIDVLVLGNWVHQVAMDEDSMDVALQWLERLRDVELRMGCRVFPPLDYSVTFARKELVAQLLERCVVPPARAIPTLVVRQEWKEWKERLGAFAKGRKSVVLKRTVSECKYHVRVVKTTALSSFTLGKWPWIAQPYVHEFEKHNELRLYVINGRFLWGVSSNFSDDEREMSLFPFAQGRVGGDWDPQAVKVAESLAGALAKHHAGAAYFLRLDLVRCDESGWYVNEVEFFGNTALHLEVMDDAYEIFPQLVECIKDWMRL